MNGKRRSSSSGNHPARVTRSRQPSRGEDAGERPVVTGWRRLRQLAWMHFVKGVAYAAGSALITFVMAWLLR